MVSEDVVSGGKNGSGSTCVLHVSGLESLLNGSDGLENGLKVESVGPEKALKRVEDGVDCVICEFGLPEGNGLDFFEEVRSVDKGVPFVLFTGEGGEDVVSEALSKGVDGYVQESEGLDRLEDVIEKVVAERVAEEASFDQQLLDDLLSHTPDTVVFKDSSHRFVKVSDSKAEEVGEDSRENLVGKRDSDYLREEVAEQIRKDEEELMDRGEVMEKEEHIVTKEGEEKWVSARQVPRFDSDGNVVGVLGISRHITEKKRREKILNSLHETTRDLMMAEKPEEIFEIAVEASEQTIGMPAAVYEENRLKTCSEEMQQLRQDKDLEELADRIALCSVEEGEDYFLEDTEKSSYRVALEIGENWVILFMEEDEELSRYKKEAARILASNVEAALKRARHQQKNRRLEEFAEIVSHDLRNPLNLAEGYLELSKEEEDDYFDEIEEAHQRMKQIIEDMLELAKKGKTVEEPKRFMLEDAVDEAVQNTSLENVSKDIQGIEIEGDKTRVTQMFENMFRNVKDHAGEGTKVEIEATDSGFIVKDHGPGIPEEERDKIFRYNFSTKNQSGIGMAEVKRIADAHKWDIQAKRAENGGALFEIET